MAVDVGALIAESIDGYYKTRVYLDGRRETAAARRACFEAIRELDELVLGEAIGDFDAHVQARKSELGQQGKEFGQDPRHHRGDKDTGEHLGDDSKSYRAGYKTGWRAAKEGREMKIPEGKDQHYSDGYEHGYKKRQVGGQILKKHDEAQQLRDRAEAHSPRAKPTRMVKDPKDPTKEKKVADRANWDLMGDESHAPAREAYDELDRMIAQHFTGPSQSYHFPGAQKEEDLPDWAHQAAEAAKRQGHIDDADDEEDYLDPEFGDFGDDDEDGEEDRWGRLQDPEDYNDQDQDDDAAERERLGLDDDDPAAEFLRQQEKGQAAPGEPPADPDQAPEKPKRKPGGGFAGQAANMAWDQWAGTAQDPSGPRSRYGHGSGMLHAVKTIQDIDRSLDEVPEGADDHGEHGKDHTVEPQDGKHHVNARPHPADWGANLGGRFRRKLSSLLKNRAIDPEGRGARDIVKGVDDVVGGEAGGIDQFAGKEGADVEQKTKELWEPYKEEILKMAVGPEAIAAHNSGQTNPDISDFQSRNYQLHDVHDALEHAHDLWRKQIISDARKAQEGGHKALQPVKVTGGGEEVQALNPDGTPRVHSDGRPYTGHKPGEQITYDPVDMLEKALNDPHGFKHKGRGGEGWKDRIYGAKNEDGSPVYPGLHNMHGRKGSIDPNNPAGKGALHPATIKVDKAIRKAMNWMHEHPLGDEEHDMWDHHYGFAEGADPEQRMFRSRMTHDQKVQHVKALRQRFVASRPGKFGRDAWRKTQAGKPKGGLDDAAVERAAQIKQARQDRRKQFAPFYPAGAAQEEFAYFMLGLLDEWIDQNVSITEDARMNVMDALFTRIEANYGNLFEVAY